MQDYIVWSQKGFMSKYIVGLCLILTICFSFIFSLYIHVQHLTPFPPFTQIDFLYQIYIAPYPIFSTLSLLPYILNSQPHPVFSTHSLILYSQLLASSYLLNSQSPPISSQLITPSHIFSTHCPLPYLLNSQPPPVFSTPTLYCILNSLSSPLYSQLPNVCSKHILLENRQFLSLCFV